MKRRKKREKRKQLKKEIVLKRYIEQGENLNDKKETCVHNRITTYVIAFHMYKRKFILFFIT